ncbi:MAG: hypothetical protein JJU37_05725 [Balneolaceae bacterium]|nr:hypothetical protein [Balneolaceae bacterium]
MYKTISFGEVLWDIFPDYKKPGGSPANLAYHLHVLGNKSILVSRVGKDRNGDELLDFLSEKEISTDHIQTDSKQLTGVVDVEFKGDEPFYTIGQPSAWDYIEAYISILKEAKSVHAICFASLAQRNSTSAESLKKLLLNTPQNCLKVFDLNLRPPFINREAILQSIELSDVIKLNEHEYSMVSGWFETDSLAEDLLKENPKKTILITLGADGSAMHTSNGYYKESAWPITGKGDFVGVGDAFLACFTHLKLRNCAEDKILKLSNKYAAYVASQQGGMPEIPDELKNEMK